MKSNLKKLKITPKKRSKETNPLKIFESLTLRGTIENIWDPQSEALRGLGRRPDKERCRHRDEHWRRQDADRPADRSVPGK
jgi:hypothetical protein